MIDADTGMTFIDFVVERHKVWEQRQAGEPQPWTSDPVLATRKFTNTFRWLDPGSQFVITDLLDDATTEEDFLLRCFLYRHTNLPAAWRAVRADLGEYPTLENLEDVREVWHDCKRAGGRIFSGAYMIYPQSSTPGTDKIDSIVDLTKRVADAGVFTKFLEADTQQARFSILRANKGVADFMSMQILTDFGYGTEYREDEYVVAGPGAVKGAKALSSRLKPGEVIDWAHKVLLFHPETPKVAGRTLSKMDVQNCLCEFSKYVRFASKPSPEKLYAPAHPGVQLPPVVPPLWTTD